MGGWSCEVHVCVCVCHSGGEWVAGPVRCMYVFVFGFMCVKRGKGSVPTSIVCVFAWAVN